MKESTQSKEKEHTLDSLAKKFTMYFAQCDYEQALMQANKAIDSLPKVMMPYSDAASCCVLLGRFDEAIAYATKAYKMGGRHFSVYDALAHAYGAKHDMEHVKIWGHEVLKIRDEQFGKLPKRIPHTVHVENLKSINAENIDRNIIAFSLFGSNPKYCETAIVNVIDAKEIYPYWRTLFYVDDSVPTNVIERLRENGARVIHVDEETSKIPGPMWRFLAYDLDGVDRVIFRDCDSVVSDREASVVDKWSQSNKAFHTIRDSGSHTELMLAGLWGCKRGSLPSMIELIKLFMQKKIESMHFADQFFLREYVWVYAKESLLQHDSIFGFLDAEPFCDGLWHQDFQVGCTDSGGTFSFASTKPNGELVDWGFVDTRGNDEKIICRYSSVVENGNVTISFPKKYRLMLSAGTGTIKVYS